MLHTNTNNTWAPDYSVHPGEVLEEHLEARGLSQAAFARLCGITPKHVSEIVNGKNPITSDTALIFEKVLGVSASIWSGIDADWQLFQAKEKEKHAAQHCADWIKIFPLDFLKTLKRSVGTDAVALRNAILSFFGVGSEAAYESRWADRCAAYRHSPTFSSKDAALSVWLRLGEIEAEKLEMPPFSKVKLKAAILEIRPLTLLSQVEYMPRIKNILRECGVAFIIIPGIKGAPVSGATHKAANGRFIIQASLRHKTNDHFWFTLFHEIGHLMLHGDKIFIEGNSASPSDANQQYERQADEFSTKILLNDKPLDVFPQTRENILAFSSRLGIHPGIIVGMLQHRKSLAWSKFSDLRLKMTEDGL